MLLRIAASHWVTFFEEAEVAKQGFIRGVLSVLVFVASVSAWAAGPGLLPFQEGKGTIGLLCTGADGRQFGTPSFAQALNACNPAASNFRDCAQVQTEAAQREFEGCTQSVMAQWTEEAISNRRVDLTGTIWSYIDGARIYQIQAMSMRSAVISRRSRR